MGTAPSIDGAEHIHPALSSAPPPSLDPAGSGASMGGTYRALPRQLWPLWQRRVQQAVAHGTVSDAIVRLLELPKMALPQPKKRMRARHRERELRAGLAGCPIPETESALAAPDRAPDPTVARARCLIRMGQYAKAVQALMPKEALPERTKVLEQLRLLHPKGAVPQPCAGAAPVIFDIAEDELRRTVARMCHATTPGPSGLTEELINAALGDAVVAQRLCEMVAAIVNNQVTPAAANSLRSCTLVALGKKDGKIRPIAMGESLLKIASAVVLKRFEEPIRQFFAPLQFGVCMPGGVESVAHAVRQEVEDGSVVLTIDAKNAFNTPDRDAIRKALLKADVFAPFRALFDLEYGAHSDLLYGEDVIASERGVRQGSTLGPLFFCAAMHPLLQDLATRFPGVRVRAYMDDVTLTGSLPDVHGAYRHFASSLLQMQVEVHPAKCEAFAADWRSHDADRLQKLRDDKIAVQAHAIRVLGAIIGSDVEASTSIASTAAKHGGFFGLVARLPVEEQLALLGTCGVPKMGFLVRTHRPEVAKHGVEVFETMLRNAVERLAEVQLDDDGRAAASLPVEMGGLGLRDWRPIAAIAYDASRSGKRGKQKTDTMAHDASEQKRLQVAGRIRVDATQPDSAAAFKPPHVNELAAEPLPPRFLSAYLRLRLGLPHADLPAGVKCDGCGKHFVDPREWMPHVVSCANRTAPNVSTTHSQLKAGMHNLLHAAGVAVEAKEPADYASVQCTGCKHQVHLAAWHAHTTECPNSAPGHTRGTDLRFYLAADGAHVVDFSTITEDVSSYAGKSLAALEDARVLRKTGQYAEQAARQGEKLHVAVAFAGGFLGAEALKLCRTIEVGSGGRVSAKDATRALRRAVAFGMGATLAAAEARTGVRHRHADEAPVTPPVVPERTDDAAVFAPHQPTPVAGLLRVAADGPVKRKPGRPLGSRKSVSPPPVPPAWACAADCAPLPSLSPSPPPLPPARRLQAAAPFAGHATAQPLVTFDLSTRAVTPMAATTSTQLVSTLHTALPAAALMTLSSAAPSTTLPQPLHTVLPAAALSTHTDAAPSTTLPQPRPSLLPAAAPMTPIPAAPSNTLPPAPSPTPITSSFLPTKAMIAMRLRTQRARKAEMRQRDAELFALLAPQPAVARQATTPRRAGGNRTSAPAMAPPPETAPLAATPQRNPSPPAPAPATPLAADPPAAVEAGRSPSAQPAAEAPSPPAVPSASPPAAAAPAASRPTRRHRAPPANAARPPVRAARKPNAPRLSAKSAAARPQRPTPRPLKTRTAKRSAVPIVAPLTPQPAADGLVLAPPPGSPGRPPLPPPTPLPIARALWPEPSPAETPAPRILPLEGPATPADAAATPTALAALPALPAAGDSSPRKKRKGVKAKALLAGVVTRRLVQAKAARTALAEATLECARLSEEHLELYAALRSAAIGDGAGAALPRVVDRTTVARLQRTIVTLVKKGRAPDLPADWEAQLEELLAHAPPPSGPYDAFRGV